MLQVLTLVYRHLLPSTYLAKQLCDNKKQQKLFVQVYNLKVYDVIKYMPKTLQKYHATVIISHASGFCVM